MNCPRCNASYRHTTVTESRERTDGSLRRRRVCGECGERFTTLELVVDLSSPRLEFKAVSTRTLQELRALQRQLNKVLNQATQ